MLDIDSQHTVGEIDTAFLKIRTLRARLSSHAFSAIEPNPLKREFYLVLSDSPLCEGELDTFLDDWPSICEFYCFSWYIRSYMFIFPQ